MRYIILYLQDGEISNENLLTLAGFEPDLPPHKTHARWKESAIFEVIRSIRTIYVICVISGNAKSIVHFQKHLKFQTLELFEPTSFGFPDQVSKRYEIEP